MITFLIDTDWLVDFLNGRDAARLLFESIADQGIGISAITYAELYDGARNSRNATERLDQLTQLAETLDVVPFDAQMAGSFAEIRSRLRATGQAIPDMDALIAATAMTRELTLVSRDRHFSRVTGLRLRGS